MLKIRRQKEKGNRMAGLKQIVAFLDKELDINVFEDSSHNGLQVENSGKVEKVCCGVDASLEFFETANALGADMLICHHGLSWGDSMSRITGLNYKRLSYLMRNDMALYGCHLPLDAHSRYGNNAQICKSLGLRGLKRFGMYRGEMLGYRGTFPKAKRYSSFKKQVAGIMGREPECMDFGKKTVRTVAVVSGAAGAELEQAGRAGVDVYLSGEPSLTAYNLAMEWEINAVFGGHYATEVFGVRSLVEVLKRRFKVKAEFVDLQVKY